MKILICNPNTDLPVRNQAGTLSNTSAICPPLGIGYLTSVLRAEGLDTVMYDFFGSSEEEIERCLRAESPDVVGVSCFTEQRGAALQVARLAKTVRPSVHVVMGGSHASFYPRRMLERYPEIDSIVMYEGETPLLEWMRCLGESPAPESAPAGVAFRRDGKVVVTERAPFTPELDTLPFPARDVANSPPYIAYPHGYARGRQASMMATRGCPYRCQFCSTTRYWGSHYRTRGAENVLGEMEHLVHERKVDYIQFFDDALTARKKWFLGLCEEIVRRGLRVDWEAITRVNYVDEDICRAMKRAGCRTVIFGVESFSDRILKGIHKGVTGAQAVSALRTARKCGLHVTCLMMVGNPGETWETIRESAQGIRAARPDNMDVTLTAVFPRTELYEIATEAGLLDDSYWLDESLAAPLFTVEHSVETLGEFREALHDALWASNTWVSLY
ncbi:B12-binding domain-containing radical SAM protein, partial [Verrucomicrobiota bacterium]